MISDLFINITILTSFTFMWHQLFRNNRLTPNSPLKIKLLDGLIGGILGITLMHYSIQVNEITILDLRHIAVILLAYFGGIIPSLIAAAIISVGRFFIDVNFSSFVSLFMMFTMAIGAGLIAKYLKQEGLIKWTVLLIYTQTIFTLALYVVVDNFSLVIDVAIYHILSSIIGGYLTFYFVTYIRRYTQLYLKYKENSQRDPLTELYNVRSFDYFYNLMLDSVKQEGGNCAVCLVDVDHFKKVNDTYGHTAGDQVLRQLAKLLGKLMREGDIVSRNGGEEFSILLEDCNLTQAEEIANRIRKAVEQYHFVLPDKQKIKLTVSIGVAAFNFESSDDNLYESADDALYKAKRTGRNNVCS
ncbi:diguanylate cyclase [Anaerobacillus isosaccharinicus]|uniref:Diguanylate cyclase n=2 Tax=Anaerobacillus isosaccharinicus TaxID=1532552 RepID=A0A7S7L3I4_9BACI|nr:diguanylate cyclase [Anaerobacillus isosaccharinicus]MBA5588080.1 diguanylate cyclase [Anaerobacillus isosaccharinicus]QOY33781.1 diguanylate cyclase [Anaerobacillus isosaccharinicus]